MRGSAAATMAEFDALTDQTAATEDRIVRRTQGLVQRASEHHDALRAVILHVQFLLLERAARKQLAGWRERISQIEEIPNEHKATAISLAASLGNMARQLFVAADRADTCIARLSQGPSHWDRRLRLRICAIWAARIENLAYMAEDCAENLALGASSEFTALVQNELHATT